MKETYFVRNTLAGSKYGGGGGGGGGGECFNQRSKEVRPTHCRVGPAQVSSPQVNLTSCGLDKTAVRPLLS
jgi:hypothetical protein